MSVHESTKDAQFPFSRFAEDSAAHRKSRDFWERAFVGVLKEKAEGWQNWMQDPFKDGHPILSKIDAGLSRGILLQQIEKSDDKFWFKCWISNTEGHDRNNDMPYLLVETFISMPARDRFQRLVEAWCVRRLDAERMRRMTEEVRLAAAEEYQAIDFGLLPSS